MGLYEKIPSVIRRPAILAFKKQMIDPDIKARTATEVITLRFSGHMVPKLPIIIPNELKLANPQIANVAIAELRNYNERNKSDHSISNRYQYQNEIKSHRNFMVLFQDAKSLISNEFIDYCFGCNNSADFLTIFPRNTDDIRKWHK